MVSTLQMEKKEEGDVGAQEGQEDLPTAKVLVTSASSQSGLYCEGRQPLLSTWGEPQQTSAYLLSRFPYSGWRAVTVEAARSKRCRNQPFTCSHLSTTVRDWIQGFKDASQVFYYAAPQLHQCINMGANFEKQMLLHFERRCIVVGMYTDINQYKKSIRHL